MLETVNKHFSTIKTRSIIEPDKMYDKFPKLACVPQALKMDFTRILNKPFFIASVPWTTSAPIGNELFRASGAPFTSGFNVPDSLFLNALSKIPFQSSTLYRGKVRLIVQVAGTPMHQGSILLAAQPPGFALAQTVITPRFNNLMAGPHVFAFANESTAVSLEVPFYYNTKLGKTDLDNTTIQPNYSFGNYAQILAVVLNPLQGPAGASTSLSFSVHAEFTEMEFYAPHVDVVYETLAAQGVLEEFKKVGTGVVDSAFSTAGTVTQDILDRIRGSVRAYTGLDADNNPNIKDKHHVVNRQHANLVDMPKQFEKMDPYGDFDRICDDYIFDTDRDEMLMREIITKPQYVDTFKVGANYPTGQILWTRPISPVSQCYKSTYTNTQGEVITTRGWDNLFQTMYSMTKFWRGTIKLHIQSSMSNFHYCKLLVAKDYSIRKPGLISYPTFGSVPNLLTDTLEFSAGGQVQTIELPFISPIELQPNSFDWRLVASQVGMYYIYLAQPLVVNGSVVSSVNFNVYISAGDDFSFYGYANNPLRLEIPGLINIPPADEELEAQGDKNTSFDAKVPEPVGSQIDVTFTNRVEKLPYDTSIARPVVSVRDMLRRMYLVNKTMIKPETLSEERGILSYDVAYLLGLRSPVGTETNNIRSTPASTLRIIQNMFHGYSGGGRFKIVVTGSSKATAWYSPPSFMLQSPNSAQTTGYQLWTSMGTIPNSSQQKVEAIQAKLPVPIDNVYEEFSVQTVTQELSNVRVNGAYANQRYGDELGVASGYCELEMEIPNLSPYRFMGDYVSKYGPGIQVMKNTPTTNMGFIHVCVPQQWAQGLEPRTTAIEVSIYAAVDDVARCGYQVHSPPCLWPATIVGTGAPQPNFSVGTTEFAVPGTAQLDVEPLATTFYAIDV